MKRILVVRGGAIGDFILTLPGLKALRDAYPASHIEILGYAHIAALADGRFYANAIRSIEYGALSRFFARGAELPDDLAEYFSGFDLIISYLFDPDRIFQTNLERAGASDIILGPSKLRGDAHAAVQLARPMIEDLQLEVAGDGAEVFVNDDDTSAAQHFLEGMRAPFVALHPGSGSQKKNWPLKHWIELADRLLADPGFLGSLIIVSGEADEAQADAFTYLLGHERVRFAHNLPLPELAAILRDGLFVGHDSGISHLAAASGANCILLFGPSDPKVWAPANANVRVLESRDGDLANLLTQEVFDTVQGRVASQPPT